MTRLALLVAGVVVLLSLAGTLLSGWFLLAAGAQTSAACDAAPAALDQTVPAELRPVFAAAAAKYDLGSQGSAVLAGLTKVESDFGRNMGPSSAGAVGWTQFMPGTWRQYAVDADRDGRRDPMNAVDAIFTAARYLRALGAPGDWRKALFGYNHAGWYVNRVLRTARRLMSADVAPAADLELVAATCESGEPSTSGVLGPGGRVVGGGGIVPVPWQPGVSIDERLLPDLAVLRQRFHIALTDGYSLDPVHAADGEHPLGLAVDIVPGPGGSWDDIDRLAHLAEPQQDHPVPPWRWVGYDGDPNHGRGNHLHLSWLHGAAAPGYRPPAAWVRVLSTAR